MENYTILFSVFFAVEIAGLAIMLLMMYNRIPRTSNCINLGLGLIAMGISVKAGLVFSEMVKEWRI